MLPSKYSPRSPKAELVARWLTPSREIRLTVLAFDFREGGSYRFAYHVPGAATVIVAGSYSVIKPPSKIVFSWVISLLFSVFASALSSSWPLGQVYR